MMETGAHAHRLHGVSRRRRQHRTAIAGDRRTAADAYIGTPSFLSILLEKAAETGVALPWLRKALVAGEAFPPSLRDWLRERGIEAYQSYATADLGLIAYETAAREGLVLDEGVIVEIVRPGTGEPVPEGEVGEVVVTTLNPDYPLIRFGTGDLSRGPAGPLPDRAHQHAHQGLDGPRRPDDQGARHVRPSQPGGRHHQAPPRAGAARLVVEGEMANDRMTLQVEARRRAEGLADASAAAPRRHQAARRGASARRAACPTTAR